MVSSRDDAFDYSSNESIGDGLPLAGESIGAVWLAKVQLLRETLARPSECLLDALRAVFNPQSELLRLFVIDRVVPTSVARFTGSHALAKAMPKR